MRRDRPRQKLQIHRGRPAAPTQGVRADRPLLHRYAPVFGELMADYATGGGSLLPLAESFSIGRFDGGYMAQFWAQVAGRHYTLAVEEVSL